MNVIDEFITTVQSSLDAGRNSFILKGPNDPGRKGGQKNKTTTNAMERCIMKVGGDYFYGVDTQPNISFYMSVGRCRRATLRYHECGISLLVPPKDKMTFMFK